MADARDGFALLDACGRLERACSRDEYSFPFSPFQSAHDIGRKDGCDASATRRARVHILLVYIEHFASAVDVIFAHINSVAGEEVNNNLSSDLAEVARCNKVVIGWICVRVFKMFFKV